jgi:hypothetical protein
MIYSHKSLIVLALGIVLFASISGRAQAQQDKTPPTKEEIAALREKAFKVLDTVAGQLTTLQSVENRARMGANLVDSLWEHDEQRARSLLRVVQEDIKSELQKRDLDGEARYDVRFQVFLKLRRDTIERIAKYDGQAAYDFLKVTEPVFENQEPYEYRENEDGLELRLAKQIAANNPDMALKIGRESLRSSMNTDVLRVLGRLNRKHKEQAHVLYKEIVEKLPDADFVEAWNVREFTQSLVRTYEPPDVDETLYRQLIGILVSKALEKGCTNKPAGEEDERADFCQWVASTLARAERYDSRIPRIKHWSHGENEQWTLAVVYEEAQELLQERAYDQVEALTAKYPQLQAGIYEQAIYRAMYAGDVDHVRKMIDRLPADNPERRQMLLAQIERMEEKPVIDEAKLTEIDAALKEIPAGKKRAESLMIAASQLSSIDRKLGLKFLDQAAEHIETLQPGKEQTQARLFLAMLYCQHKNDRGFSMMESLLPKLNELVDIAVKLDGFDTNYLRDGEWNMSASGGVGEILTRLSERAGFFAWSDFDRAVSLASQFERPEIRLMAQLKLAQSILSGPPKPFAAFTIETDYLIRRH